MNIGQLEWKILERKVTEIFRFNFLIALDEETAV